MARGMGLLGEAGPEAVMPLRRTPSGRLGVEAQPTKMEVHIHNNANAQVTTQERPGGGLDIFVDQVKNAIAQDMARPGTSLNQALGKAANPLRAR
jgi:phage-related minor tail protein